MSESVPKIFGALARVMAEIGAVGKFGHNNQQNYAFRGIDDVMAAAQPLLAKHGVVVVPAVREREREAGSTKGGGVMFSVRLLVDHHFFAEDGSSVVCTTLGEAMDTSDKASNKAMTAALKYALVQTLMIPTYEAGRDADESSPGWEAQGQDRGDPRDQQQGSTSQASQPRQATQQRQQDNDGPEAHAERLRQASLVAKTHEELDALVQKIVALPTDLQAQPKAAAQGRRKKLIETLGQPVRPAKANGTNGHTERQPGQEG